MRAFICHKPNGTEYFKNVKKCLNTNIYSYLETSGGQSSNKFINVVHFFNTSVNQTSVSAQDICFPALASNTCSSIIRNYYSEKFALLQCPL